MQFLYNLFGIPNVFVCICNCQVHYLNSPVGHCTMYTIKLPREAHWQSVCCFLFYLNMYSRCAPKALEFSQLGQVIDFGNKIPLWFWIMVSVEQGMSYTSRTWPGVWGPNLCGMRSLADIGGRLNAHLWLC